MAYSGPVWQSTAGADKRGEFYLQAGKDLGEGIGKAVGGFSKMLKDLASDKDQAKALETGLEGMKATRPDLVPLLEAPEFQDAFAGANLKGKQILFSQALALGQRADQQAQQQQQYGLDNRRVLVAESQAAHAMDPVLPVQHTSPGGKSMMINPKTGMPVDEPEGDGDWVAKEGYPGHLFHKKGDSFTGASVNIAKTVEQDGVKMSPVVGSDLWMKTTGGKPVGTETYRRKAAPWWDVKAHLSGGGAFEVVPDKPEKSTKPVIYNGRAGFLRSNPDGTTDFMEGKQEDSKEKYVPKWQRIPGTEAASATPATAPKKPVTKPW